MRPDRAASRPEPPSARGCWIEEIAALARCVPGTASAAPWETQKLQLLLQGDANATATAPQTPPLQPRTATAAGTGVPGPPGSGAGSGALNPALNPAGRPAPSSQALGLFHEERERQGRQPASLPACLLPTPRGAVRCHHRSVRRESPVLGPGTHSITLQPPPQEPPGSLGCPHNQTTERGAQGTGNLLEAGSSIGVPLAAQRTGVPQP